MKRFIIEREIPDAGHTSGMHVHPREYERRVISFLDEAL